jgi:carbohydrate binding protein with CBM4/9 domain
MARAWLSSLAETNLSMPMAQDLPAKKRALIFGLLLLTAVYILVTGTQFAAEWLGSRPQLASLRAATRLDPGNALYHYRLSRYYDLVARDPAAAIAESNIAVRLNPHSAHYWLELADSYQMLGDMNLQAHAIERAIQADPTTPDVAWEAANLYLVQGQTDKAFEEFHVVLDGAGYMAGLVLNLCWRVRQDPDVFLRQVLPAGSGYYFAFLDLLMSKQNTEATTKVWDAIISLHQPIDLQRVFEYIRYLLLHKEPAEAKVVWREAASPLRLNAYLPSSNNLIVNGDFSLDVLNGGFDWQYRKQSSVSLILDTSDFHTGHRSLAITFDGPGVDEAGIYQLVSVQPNTTYQFSGYYRNGEIEGAGAPRFALQDLYSSKTFFISDELKYGSAWRNVSGEFTTDADTQILVLRVARVPAGAAIRGKLWIDDFRLIEKPPDEGHS